MKHAAAGMGSHSGRVLRRVDDASTGVARNLPRNCSRSAHGKSLSSSLRRRPDVIEEFDSEAYRAALKQSIQKWRPELVQLEFTQMAQYAGDCYPAKTILVEHDITFDLQQQLLDLGIGDGSRALGDGTAAKKMEGL